MLPRTPSMRESDGIVMSGAFIVKVRTEAAKRTAQVDIEIMQLHCYVVGVGGLGSAHESGTVLAPADLSLKMSRGASHDGGTKMELSLIAAQALECYISYRDCKLTVEILDGLRKASLQAAANYLGETDAAPAAASLAEPTVLPLAPPPPPSPSLTDSSALAAPTAAAAPAPEAQLSAAMQIEGVRIVLLNDFDGRQVPRLAPSTAPATS